MGAIVLGALTANFVSVSSPFVIKVGAVKLGLQEDILDKLFKGILPLGITLLTIYLLKNRKMKSTRVMLVLVAIGVLFGAFNIF